MSGYVCSVTLEKDYVLRWPHPNPQIWVLATTAAGHLTNLARLEPARA